MSKGISPIWSKKLSGHDRDNAYKTLQSLSPKGQKLKVFFRADDIALVDEPFRKLMHLFQSHEIPLCLAVVPDWLDGDSWSQMAEFKPETPLWCWHQHGKSHRNHETQGKKCEFGDSRTREAIKADLVAGKDILSQIMGDLFFPVFTPPWNRCGLNTLELLQELKYKAVSRSEGAKPPAEGILPDLAVNVDLHTRRESDFSDGWQNLMNEFAQAAESGCMGIMLHHQLMNEKSFAFLDLLLGELRSMETVEWCTFRELCF